MDLWQCWCATLRIHVTGFRAGFGVKKFTNLIQQILENSFEIKLPLSSRIPFAYMNNRS